MRLLAAVIVFRPDGRAFANIARIAAQFPGDLLVVDDSGDGEPAPEARGFEILRNRANYGQAYSLNLALTIAAERGYDHLATFDQDTSLAPWYRRHLEGAIAMGRGAVIGAAYAKSEGELPAREPEQALLGTRTVITSGAAYPVQAILGLGGFREDFFIDHVDDEVCLRARAAGLKVLSLRFPVMVHLIGRRLRATRGPLNALKNLFGTTEHAPMRWYYMTRNYCILFREYGAREPYWTARTLALTVRLLLGVALFEGGKKAKFAAAWKGLRHAIAGTRGRIPWPA